jgi:hypothetical protein
LKFISKSGENKKSPDFATQSGRLFGMSPIQGKRVSVIPADHFIKHARNHFKKPRKQKKSRLCNAKWTFVWDERHLGKTRQRNPSGIDLSNTFETISKNRENKKSPKFATQSGRLEVAL